MIEQAAQAEIDEEPTLDLSQLPPKHAAFALLKENGIRTPDAAKMLGYNKDYAYQIQANLRKYSLTNRKMVKAASTVVKNILDGKCWGSVEKIKDSTALAASGMVLDRVWPIVHQTQALNVNVDINAVDYSRYMGDFTSGKQDE